MSQTLYEEAIAEARRLTEMAEQNAKNKIIDAVTPQIRRLIEQELSGDDDDMDDLGDIEDSGEVETDTVSFDLDSIAGQPASVAAPPVSPKAPAPSLKMDGGEIEITVGGTKIEIEPADGAEGDEDMGDQDNLLLDEPVMEALERMVAGSRAGRSALRAKLEKLHGRTELLRQAMAEAKKTGSRSQKRRLAGIFETLAREAVALRKQVILTESSAGGRTPETKLINSIIKEMKDMSRRNGKNVFDFLFEAEEGEDKDVEMDMGDMGGDEGGDEKADVDVDDLKRVLVDLADVLGMSVSDESDESDEGDEGDEGDEDDVLELEADTLEGAHAKMDEMDHMDKVEETVYELEESTLRRALSSMRRGRRGRRINEEAVDAAASFGGGEAGDEMFIDVDEETLLNVLADELGAAPRPKVGGAQLAKESRGARASLAEATRLRRQVADYRKVAAQLKGQLVEMNLFNAKLLYANKLMQNRDLSAKQQRAIVEALDNAKTLREAKLLYKSLTESLNKGANKGSLTEGRTRVLGSSSKSARSAQPINEAGGTDRWAVLAGIKKD